MSRIFVLCLICFTLILSSGCSDKARIETTKADFLAYSNFVAEGNANNVKNFLEGRKSNFKTWQKIAGKNVPEGQILLGLCYFYGVNVKENKKEAVNWFRKAADQKFAEGQYQLGKCYFHGEGIDQDKPEGVKWLFKAKEQGHQRADALFQITKGTTRANTVDVAFRTTEEGSSKTEPPTPCATEQEAATRTEQKQGARQAEEAQQRIATELLERKKKEQEEQERKQQEAAVVAEAEQKRNEREEEWRKQPFDVKWANYKSPFDDPWGRKGIWEAAKKGTLRDVEYFIDKGVDVNARSHDKKTPLHEAAYAGKLDIVEFLVAKGADVNAVSGAVFFLGDNIGSETPLRMAAGEGFHHPSNKNFWAIVKFLASNGADVNICRPGSLSPLHLAAQSGNIEMVKFLVANGANVNARDKQGITPAQTTRARTGEDNEILPFLISKGANINAQDAGNMLFTLLRSRRDLFEYDEKFVEEVKRLVSMGANVNVRGEGRDIEEDLHTPLHEVICSFRSGGRNNNGEAMARKIEVIELLIASGADVNAKTAYYRNTPLHYVTLHARSQEDIIGKLLISNGADLNVKNRSGATPYEGTIYVDGSIHRYAGGTRSSSPPQSFRVGDSESSVRNALGKPTYEIATETSTGTVRTLTYGDSSANTMYFIRDNKVETIKRTGADASKS